MQCDCVYACFCVGLADASSEAVAPSSKPGGVVLRAVRFTSVCTLTCITVYVRDMHACMCTLSLTCTVQRVHQHSFSDSFRTSAVFSTDAWFYVCVCVLVSVLAPLILLRAG